MIRGFLAGTFWGVILAGLGLGILSVSVPLSNGPSGADGADIAAQAAPDGVTTVPEAGASGAVASGEQTALLPAEAPASDSVVAGTDAATKAVPEQLTSEAPQEDQPGPVPEVVRTAPEIDPPGAAPGLSEVPQVLPQPMSALPEPRAPEVGAQGASESAPPDVPALPGGPVVIPLAPAQPPAPQAQEQTGAQAGLAMGASRPLEMPVAPEPLPSPSANRAPAPAQVPARVVPADGGAGTAGESLPGSGQAAAPEAEAPASPVPTPADPATQTGDAEPQAPSADATDATDAPTEGAVLRPQPGLAGSVPGVRTGRLPRIDAGEVAPSDDASAEETDQTAEMPEASEAGTDAPALIRNARPFTNPEGRPPMAVVLLDDAAAGVDLAALAAGALPVTLAIDPAQPDAVARAEAWRAAGQEVVILSSTLPLAGTPNDMEVAIEALVASVPAALAILDMPAFGLQADGAMAAALIPALDARGFGLLTWDRGLNPADQRARRAGLPAARVFRDLDAEDEAAPVIRRYLDRAVFKAQQDGQVIVVGRMRAQTVEGLLDWMNNGRLGDVAPAPVSALLMPAR